MLIVINQEEKVFTVHKQSQCLLYQMDCRVKLTLFWSGSLMYTGVNLVPRAPFPGFGPAAKAREKRPGDEVALGSQFGMVNRP